VTALPQTDPYRILVVCTGNICRSPFAERLLQDAFGRIAFAASDDAWRAGVQVASAGTHAMVGNPIEPTMADQLEPYGSAGFDHVARQLERELIADADLVLALTRDHRRDIVRLLPNASRRVFALGEFVRLLEDAVAADAIEAGQSVPAPELMAAVVEGAAARRGFVPAPDDPAVDDVIDPYRRAAGVYEASAAQIAEFIGRIEAAILREMRATV